MVLMINATCILCQVLCNKPHEWLSSTFVSLLCRTGRNELHHTWIKSVGVAFCEMVAEQTCRPATHSLTHTATYTATHYNITISLVTHKFRGWVSCLAKWWRNGLRCFIVYCNTMKHRATHCNTLQHTATHCNNTLQLTATHSRVAKQSRGLDCTGHFLQKNH